jgi:hypothetical protein
MTSDDDGWERRMAERYLEHAGSMPNDDHEWAREIHHAQRAEVARVRAKMTLDDAIKRRHYPPLACACSGPPDCCVDMANVADQVHAAAQRLVNGLVALARKKSLNHWSCYLDDPDIERRGHVDGQYGAFRYIRKSTGQACYLIEHFEQSMTPGELAEWKKPPDPDLMADLLHEAMERGEL